MPPPLRVRCHAKINASLAVLGQRADGYHELETEFVALEAHDLLEVEPADAFTLDVRGLAAGVPVGDNLVLRAARLLQQEVGEAALPGARLVLDKRLPAAAGLGGGSSDAAGALRGLARLHGLALAPRALARLALELGSDVPYFLVGGRALGTGRGEVLTPLPDGPPRDVVLVKPGFELSTRAVFAEHARRTREAGVLTTRKVGTSFADEPQSPHLETRPRNDLWAAALGIAPQIADLRRDVERSLPGAVVGLAGSGPTLFALLPPGEGSAAAEGPLGALRVAGALVMATRTLGRAEQESSQFR